MKTIAVIKNELFKDYLKIVSTDNLEQVLDDPNIPLPFTCLDSVDNSNSDELAKQLVSFFEANKVKNKEFFILDDNKTSDLLFMLNLIKLSSAQSEPVHRRPLPDLPLLDNLDLNSLTKNEVESPKIVTSNETIHEDTLEEVHQNLEELNSIIEEQTSTDVIEELPVTIAAPIVQTQHEQLNPVESTPVESTDFDPFKPVLSNFQDDIDTVVEDIQVEDTTSQHNDLVSVLGIPKNSTLHYFKDNNVTATLIDENNVFFDGQLLSLNEAAKAVNKKLSIIGLPNGLNNWLYNGVTLKVLKEQNS